VNFLERGVGDFGGFREGTREAWLRPAWVISKKGGGIDDVRKKAMAGGLESLDREMT
jgi:hypothetical protein